MANLLNRRVAQTRIWSLLKHTRRLSSIRLPIESSSKLSLHLSCRYEESAPLSVLTTLPMA